MFAAAFAEGKIFAGMDNQVGKIRIENPARKNALCRNMWAAIPQAIDRLVKQSARVIVLEGSGADFSAGADISEFSEVRKDAATALAYERINVEAFRAVRECPVPTIAILRGICFGGGFGLAAATDLRFGDESARFAIPAARLGLGYPVEAMNDIVAAVGPQIARLALFTARTFSAPDMARHGFLAELVPADQLASRVDEVARIIARNAPLSVYAAKTAIRAIEDRDDALLHQARTIGEHTFESEDYREGRAAFAEKREPRFRGI